MKHADARALIQKGVLRTGGTWADLGAGSGVFTRALADLLSSEGTVYAVDRQPVSPFDIAGGASIVPLKADFTKRLELTNLDGILTANALHFARRHERVLKHIVTTLKPGGTFILVEYDIRRGSPWIPFPVPLECFKTLASKAGLGEVREIGRRRSRYGPRDIYAAIATKER